MDAPDDLMKRYSAAPVCCAGVDTESRQTHLNALERATIVKTINTAKTLGGPV